MNPVDIFYSNHWSIRILIIIVVAVIGHFLIQSVRRISEWIIDPSKTPGFTTKEFFASRHPKIATVTSLIVSALTFAIYFLALGLILKEFNVSLMAYLATASILGLAVAFGSQGLVQDVVIGLTLVFSDTFDVGDVVEISGQIGKVEKIGLRFTRIVNFMGQTVFIPNRNIALVGRFRKGCIRSYVDIQIPEQVGEEKITSFVDRTAKGMHNQFGASILADPEIFWTRKNEPGGWKFLRIKFLLWPGQDAIIETTFKQRVLAEIKSMDSSYTDWMITVNHKVN